MEPMELKSSSPAASKLGRFIDFLRAWALRQSGDDDDDEDGTATVTPAITKAPIEPTKALPLAVNSWKKKQKHTTKN